MLPGIAQQASVQRPALVVRAGEHAWPLEAAASPDGKWVVLQSARDGSLTIRSSNDLAEYRTFRPLKPGAYVNRRDLAITADSKTIVFGDSDHLVFIDAATTSVRSLPNDNGSAAIAAHPSLLAVAIVNWRGKARVVSSKDGSALFETDVAAPSPDDIVPGRWQVEFSPDGHFLTIESPLSLQLWNWESKKEILALDARSFHTANLGRQAGEKDGKPATAEDLKLFRFVGTSFSPDGMLAVASLDEVTVLRVRDGSRILRREMETAEPNRLDWTFFLASNKLAVGREIGPPYQWDLNSDTVEGIGVPDASAFVALPHRQEVLCLPVGDWESASILSLRDLHAVKILSSAAHVPNLLDWSQNGEDLFGHWFNPNTPTLDWDRESGEAVVRLGNPDNTYTVAVNGRLTVRYTGDHVRVDDIRDGKNLASFDVKAGSDYRWALSETGGILAGAGDHGVDLFSLEHRQKPISIPIPRPKHPIEIALAPGGDMVAVAMDGATVVYSVAADYKELARIPVQSEYLRGVEFSSDENFASSGKFVGGFGL